MSEDFLSRWSRRKREVREAEQAEARRPEPAREAAVEPAADAGAEQAAPPKPELTPEALDLPALEDLTPETDLSAFFHEGVPQALRNAALRRMWSLDPAIRDYVGDARDYAWDWNAPGGVPGCGPLASTDEVYATLERMFGPAPDLGTGRETAAERADALGHSVAPRDGQALDPEKESAHSETEAAGLAAPRQRLPEPSPAVVDALPKEQAAFVAPGDGPAANVAAPQQADPALIRARPRRHGRATPD